MLASQPSFWNIIERDILVYSSDSYQLMSAGKMKPGQERLRNYGYDPVSVFNKNFGLKLPYKYNYKARVEVTKPVEIKKTSWAKELLKSVAAGESIMLATAPAINYLNYNSFVQGVYKNGNKRTFVDVLKETSQHPLKGIDKHISKELPRTMIKASFLRVLRPEIYKKLERYPKFVQDIIFALLISTATEATVNGFEVSKAKKYKGQVFNWKADWKLGLFPSIIRQVPVWGLFSFFYRTSNEVLSKKTTEPCDIKYLLPKTAFCELYSPVIYPLGLTRYYVQTDKNLGNSFVKAIKHVYKTNGVKGFYSGFVFKLLSDFVLTAGAISVIECDKWLNSWKNSKDVETFENEKKYLPEALELYEDAGETDAIEKHEFDGNKVKGKQERRLAERDKQHKNNKEIFQPKI